MCGSAGPRSCCRPAEPSAAAGEGRTDDPLGALAWCAALALERGRPLRAGMIVITGSVIPTFKVAGGDRIRFAVDGIGEVAAELA